MPCSQARHHRWHEFHGANSGAVASNVDPQHFALDLLGETALGPTITEKIRRYDWGQ
jgi:hypothetical protein